MSLPVEVFRFDPSAPPPQTSDGVLWTAPGTLTASAAHLRRVWREQGRVEALGKVRGAWGAVLWDERRSRYLVATDPLGVQPVFWSRTGQHQVVVASWLAALVAEPDVSTEPDYEAILMRDCPFIGGKPIETRSNFRHVSWVPWGRVHRFDRGSGGDGPIRYWDPKAIEVQPDLSLDECASKINEALDAAVGRCLSDGLPMGVHLSGGLDCSAVAVSAQQQLRQRGDELVMGYSWSPSPDALDHTAGDERLRVRDVANLIDVPVRWLDESGDSSWYGGRDPLLYPHATTRWESFVLPQARDDGVRALLSGWGGDELASFNGRSAVETLIRSGHWREAWQMTQPWPAPSHLRNPRVRQLASAVRHSMPRVDRFRYRFNSKWREAVSLLGGESAYAAELMEQGARRWPKFTDTRTQWLDLLDDGHLQWRTMGWYQAGRLFDVFYRYPLLDVEVADAALSFPLAALRSPDWSRLAFRTAMLDRLPASVVWHSSKRDPALFHPDNPMVAVPRSQLPDQDEELMRIRQIAHQVHQLVKAATA